MSHPPLPTG
jgi:hypothetical protein